MGMGHTGSPALAGRQAHAGGRTPSARVGGLGALVIAGISWGTAGTLGTLLARASGLPFLAVAGYRITVGGALLVAYVLLTRAARWPTTGAGWRRVAAIAACSAAYQQFYFTGVALTGVSIATLVTIGSTPVMVAAFEAATGRQRLGPRLLVTLALALAGLGLLIGVPPAHLAAGQLLAGAASALGSGAAFAAITLLGARPEPDFDDATGMALSLLLGGIVVLGLAAVTGGVAFAPDARSAGLVVALGLVPTALAYLSYFRGLRSQSSTTGALVTLLEPLTGTALAALVLGERLGLAGAIGAALLLGAVLLTTLGPRTSAVNRPGADRRRLRRGRAVG